MNLKAAARRLGLHYQTAYRLVRAGDLIAIKAGSGYEISEAAIDRYLAGRQAIEAATAAELAQTAVVAPRHNDVSTTTSESVIDDLAAMLAITTLSTRPVFDLVTHHLAESIGDFAVLRLLSEDRSWLAGTSSHHHDPSRRAILAAMLTQPQPVAAAREQTTLHEGRVHRVDFLRVDVARHMIPPAFQQYADRMTIYSTLSVPVVGADRRVLGLLSLARDLPGRPYTATEEARAVEMAGWVAAAIERGERFTSGWRARNTLHDRIEALLADHPVADADELADLAVELFDNTIPEAVFDLDRHMLTCNEPFSTRAGLDPHLPLAEMGTSLVAACAMTRDAEVWQRLLSGETDYLDQMAGGCSVGCPLADGVHWALARRPDATPAFVIATCSADSRARGPKRALRDEGNRSVCQLPARAIPNS